MTIKQALWEKCFSDTGVQRLLACMLCLHVLVCGGCQKKLAMVTEQIQPEIYRIKAQRSNVYLLAGKQLTLIDTGMPGDGEGILEAIVALGRKPEELTHILITHAHIDHTGSLAFLKKATGTKCVAGAPDVDYIQGNKKTWRMGREGFGGKLFKAALFLMETFFVKYAPSSVDIPCKGNEVLDCFGGITVIATPGHSPGSLSYYAQDKRILFTGDALSGEPSLRLPPRPGCANYQEALNSAEKLSRLRFETCCCGHGDPVTPNADDLLKNLISALP